MSDYDENYLNYEPSSFNATTLDDDFIGGTSVIVIGIISFIVVILIIMAIHLFSKKLDDIQCDNGYQQFSNPQEEMEPLPQYEERESRPEGEVDLSDYIQSRNTINTIPRDTMNIINILNRTSHRDSNGHINNNNNNNINDENTDNNNNNNIHDSNSYSHHSYHGQNENGLYENDEGTEQLVAIPSTSTLPLPTPEKENMPCIPPPCYDVALTQPRINNQGMIVLPQDPSFASNLPTLTRSSSVHRHSFRRTRQRIMRIFKSHPSPHSNDNNNNNNYNNDYRFPNHTQSTYSSSPVSTASSSNSNTNLTPHDDHSNNNDSLGGNNSSENSSTSHNNNNGNSNNNSNSNNDHDHGNNNRQNSVNHRSSRSFMSRLHLGHSALSSSKKRKRNLLRLRHHSSDNDNASISSVSICPTTMIDIPEDHYNIAGTTTCEIRNHSNSHSYPFPPPVLHQNQNQNHGEIERGNVSTATIIPGLNDNSFIMHHNPSHINDTNITTIPTPNNSNIHSNISDIQLSQQTNSLEIINRTDSLVDATQYNPSLLNQEGEIINFNSVNTNNTTNTNNNNNINNDDNNNNNMDTLNRNLDIHHECINI